MPCEASPSSSAAGRQRRADFVVKIAVAGRVDQVEHVLARLGLLNCEGVRALGRCVFVAQRGRFPLMLMPSARSRSMSSRKSSRVSRWAMAPHRTRKRSAGVDLPWSMRAMMEKLRMRAMSTGQDYMGRPRVVCVFRETNVDRGKTGAARLCFL